MCRHRKGLHNEASKYYKRRADTCILSSIISGSTAGILNIALAIEPVSFVVVNIAQICLGAASLASTAIITASKQLEFEEKRLRASRTRRQVLRNTQIGSGETCVSTSER
jgi:hypothetical protein